MTTLAYRDGVLASDSAVCTRGGCYSGAVKKVFRGPAGVVAGAAGAASDCAAFERWLLESVGLAPGEWEAKDKEAGFAALVIAPGGQVLCYGEYGPGFPVQAPFYARGTGMDVALGAMAAGASAERAIEIACEYDRWSAGPVQVERLVPVNLSIVAAGGERR